MKTLAIGIDIGGTRTKIGLVNLDTGLVEAMLVTPTETSHGARFLYGIGEAISRFKATAAAGQALLAGVGIGVPGFLLAGGTVDSTYGFLEFMEDYPLEAALILSESTKLNFHGLPMAQYDHGPKETAQNSIVIQILAKGVAYNRTRRLSEQVANAGAHVFIVESPSEDELFSTLLNIISFNFMAYFLALKLNVSDTFVVGGKVTEAL